MKKFALLAFLFCSGLAHAGQGSLNLGNPNAVRDMEKVLTKFEEDCSAYVNVGNGDCDVSPVDLTQLNLETEAEELNKNTSDGWGDCSFESSIHDDLDRELDEDITDGASDSDLLPDLFSKIKEAKQLLGIVDVVWDGTSGDSEYCLIKKRWIFLKNGKKIELNLDYTD